MRKLVHPGVSPRVAALVLVAAVAVVSGAVGIASLSAAPASPTPTVAPTVNGTLTRGATLVANPGAWTTDSAPLSFAYHWFRCDSGGGSCATISGATQQSYILQAADVGNTLLVQVTAIDAEGATSAAVNSALTNNVILQTDPPPDPPVPPANVVLPSISGKTVNGSTLTAYVGQWNGFPVPEFTYLWQRCDPAGGGCNPIPGTTSSTYTLTALDVATTLRVQVTATSSAGTMSVSSAATSIVTVPLGPANTQAPTITGTPETGQTLTATNGQWSGATPLTFTYQWQRCNEQGQSCQPIQGATQQTYQPQTADVGSRLVVVVTATNSDGSASATSQATAAVTSGVPAGGTIPVSQVAPPSRLVVSAVDFEPNVIRSRAPFIARFRVTDTEGHLVSGAEVFLLGIPFGRFQPAPIVRTDANGWATFTLQPTARMPLQKGFLITIYTRATKPGDDVLAGVSARRLSSVRINPN